MMTMEIMMVKMMIMISLIMELVMKNGDEHNGRNDIINNTLQILRRLGKKRKLKIVLCNGLYG